MDTKLHSGVSHPLRMHKRNKLMMFLLLWNAICEKEWAIIHNSRSIRIDWSRENQKYIKIYSTVTHLHVPHVKNLRARLFASFVCLRAVWTYATMHTFF